MARYLRRIAGLRAAGVALVLLALAVSPDRQALAQPTAVPDRQASAPKLIRTGTVNVHSLPAPGTAGAPAGEAARHQKPFLVPDRNAYNQRKNAPQPGGRPAGEPPAPAGPAVQPPGASSRPQPPPVTNFAGLNQADNPFALLPPDNATAAGPNYVVEMVNITGRISTRAGVPIQTFLLWDFFGFPPGTYITDPRIKFDPDAQRWFAVAVGSPVPGDGGSFAALAVSTTPDPVSFLVYLFQFVGQFPDYPAIGMSGDKVALTFNDFACAEPCVSTLDGFYGSAFLIFDKAALLNGAVSFQYFPPAPQNLFTIQPAMNYHDPTVAQPPENTLRLAAGDFPTSRLVRVWTLTGLPPAVAVTTTDVLISPLSVPPPAGQRGTATLVETNDNRLLDAAWRRYPRANAVGESLWLAANDACVPGNGDNTVRACARYIEIDTGGAIPQLRQDFDLARPDTYFYFPALAIDRVGNLLSVVSESSPGRAPQRTSAPQGDFPSVVVTGRRVDAPPNTLHAPTILKAGEAPYSPVFPRYGDYSGANIDPVDQTKAWVGGEYSRNTQQVPPFSDWGTWIGQIGF